MRIYLFKYFLRSHKSLLPFVHLCLDVNYELQHLQTSQVKGYKDIFYMEWTFTSFRSSMFGKPSNTIRRSLMVGYGVPFAIVVLMGIGNELIIF